MTVLDVSLPSLIPLSMSWCLASYYRLFGAKCSKCSQSFSKNDFVMRARNKMYHPDCFCCVSCEKPLVSGDEFAIKDDHLLCKVCIRHHFRPPSDSTSNFMMTDHSIDCINSQADHEVFVKGSHRHFLQDLSSPPPGMTETDMTVMNSVSPLSNSNSSINSATGSTGNSNHGPSNKMHLTGKQNLARLVLTLCWSLSSLSWRSFFREQILSYNVVIVQRKHAFSNVCEVASRFQKRRQRLKKENELHQVPLKFMLEQTVVSPPYSEHHHYFRICCWCYVSGRKYICPPDLFTRNRVLIQSFENTHKENSPKN